VNLQILINSIVQQTVVLLAHVATFGGSRTPLVQVADRVFLNLTEELSNQGVTKNVIADMFGMALRTYHRKIRAVAESQTDAGRSIWEAVLDHIRQKGPVSARQIQMRFQYDEPAVVASVLNDLGNSGIVYRAGRGAGALFRVADQADFRDEDDQSRKEAYQYLVWLSVYRHGPIGIQDLSAGIRIDEDHCREALQALIEDGRVVEAQRDGAITYASSRFDVPVGASQGWEAAVLDHYQAVVSAICVKLRSGLSRSQQEDTVGGGTYTLEVWPGHPYEGEAFGMLGKVRQSVNGLRDRIDEYNRTAHKPAAIDEVIFYLGQYVKSDRVTSESEE
jgi:hypothetical protein